MYSEHSNANSREVNISVDAIVADINVDLILSREIIKENNFEDLVV